MISYTSSQAIRNTAIALFSKTRNAAYLLSGLLVPPKETRIIILTKEKLQIRIRFYSIKDWSYRKQNSSSTTTRKMLGIWRGWRSWMKHGVSWALGRKPRNISLKRWRKGCMMILQRFTSYLLMGAYSWILVGFSVQEQHDPILSLIKLFISLLRYVFISYV